MKRYTITVNGVAYDVTVEENSTNEVKQDRPAANPAPVQSAKPSGGISVDAPMPGNILSVNVKAGDSVTSGQVLLVLEAMKMENDIVSPKDGVIACVNVAKGESVDAGQSLVTLD